MNISNSCYFSPVQQEMCVLTGTCLKTNVIYSDYTARYTGIRTFNYYLQKIQSISLILSSYFLSLSTISTNSTAAGVLHGRTNYLSHFGASKMSPNFCGIAAVRYVFLIFDSFGLCNLFVSCLFVVSNIDLYLYFSCAAHFSNFSISTVFGRTVKLYQLH